MPFELSRGDRTILLITSLIFVVLVALSLLLGRPGDNSSPVPTTYSTASGGAKAAYLLLQDSGYRVARWENSPLNLPAGKNKILILAEPTGFPDETERHAVGTFILGGGRVIASGLLAGMMLPQNAASSESIEGMPWQSYRALTLTAITRAAPAITLSAQARWTPSSSVTALYGEQDKVVVARYPYGAGDVIWWASATPLTNAGLKEPGNLEFFLACLGEKESTLILWDEYFHGYGNAKPASKEGPLLRGTLAQVVALAIAIVLTFSRRSGPVRPSPPATRLSPLEFVETLGGLYENAHASSIAVDISYQRFNYWLSKRLGMSPTTSINELNTAVEERWNFRDANFAATLQQAALARYHSDLSPNDALRLVQSLHNYAEQFHVFPMPLKEKR